MLSRYLGIQVDGTDPRDFIYIQRVKPAVLKVLNPDPNQVADLHAASPDTVIVGRIVEPWGSLTAASGILWADKILARSARCNSIIKHWEGPNEAASTIDEIARLNDFEFAFAHKIQDNGLSALVGGFGTGSPDITNNNADPTGQWLGAWKKFEQAMREAHGLHFHEYWYPGELTSRWNAYRYQMFFKAFVANMPWVLEKNILISELGITSRTEQKGYKTYLSVSEYIALLRQYDTEMQAYPHLAATIFTAGGVNTGWGDYDIHGEVMDSLANEQQSAPVAKWGSQVSVTPPPTKDNTGGWCPFAVHQPLTDSLYWYGRGGEIVKAVCIHIAQGYMAGMIPTMQTNKVSTHFAIAKDGTIVQYVSIYDSAWHAGMSYQNGWINPRGLACNPSWVGMDNANNPGHKNPNLFTIGIEHEGFSGEIWTSTMYQSNLKLLTWIAQQLGWTSYVAHGNLIGHNAIDPIDRSRCPGPSVNLEQMAMDVPLTQPVPSASVVAICRSVAATMPRIKINPSAALFKASVTLSLGCPVGDEFTFRVDSESYVGQQFARGIVYAKQGDWGNVHLI